MMNLKDAMRIAEEWDGLLEPVCKRRLIVGSVRRRRQDVHDIEFWCDPLTTPPVPVFGDLHTFATPLDKLLYKKECEGLIRKVKAGPNYKKFNLNLEHYGLVPLNDFHLELYVLTPPRQWGVGAVIRTGPGNPEDNFSKWCVKNQAFGGGLPDGYKVKHLAVWNRDQLDSKDEPLKGEQPLIMPEESDFLSFLGLDWIEPQYRHAPHFQGVK